MLLLRFRASLQCSLEFTDLVDIGQPKKRLRPINSSLDARSAVEFNSPGIPHERSDVNVVVLRSVYEAPDEANLTRKKIRNRRLKGLLIFAVNGCYCDGVVHRLTAIAAIWAVLAAPLVLSGVWRSVRREHLRKSVLPDDVASLGQPRLSNGNSGLSDSGFSRRSQQCAISTGLGDGCSYRYF